MTGGVGVGAGSGDVAGGVAGGFVVIGVGSTGVVPPQLKEKRLRMKTAGTQGRRTRHLTCSAEQVQSSWDWKLGLPTS